MQFLKPKVAVFTAMLVCAAAIPLSLAAQSNGPTDPQIVGIVTAANQIDIEYAKLALSKSKSEQVKEFAQQMITDHSALQKAVSDLGAKLKVTPEASDTSKSLQAQAQQTTSKLKSLQGEAFDKAYIENEIAFHQVVIQANESTLIPNADNAQLKSALTGAQPLFKGHLAHAQKLQTTIESHAKTTGKTQHY